MHDLAFFNIKQHLPFGWPTKKINKVFRFCWSFCCWWISLIVPNILVSSANFKIHLAMPQSRSLIYIRKRIGPNTEPCRTPLRTNCHVDLLPFTQTRCLLLLSHSVIHFSSLPVVPWLFNFSSSLWCGTLSKALAKSRKTTSIFFLESRQPATLSKKVRG